MTSRRLRLLSPGLLLALVSAPTLAQRPFANGISVTDFAAGLQGPASIASDLQGNLYVSSIYDANGPGQPTDVFRVLPDGTVETFTAPLHDPDVLTVDAGGFVYVGAWDGWITRIDPSDGSQSTWLHHSALGNVDGLAFDADGDLLVTAIDHAIVHEVDAMTRAVQVFADLSSLPLQGLGSLVVLPDRSVFVASPKDGFLIHLGADGRLLDAAFAAGFQHMGQLAFDDEAIYVSDNVGQTIHRVDRTSREVTTLVTDVTDLAGGLLHRGGGRFYATRQSSDLTQGFVYRIEPLTISLSDRPAIGQSVVHTVTSEADADRPLVLFLTRSGGAAMLPDGRRLPVDFTWFRMIGGTFDASGRFDLTLNIPADPALVGVQFATCATSFVPGRRGPFGISEAFVVTVES